MSKRHRQLKRKRWQNSHPALAWWWASKSFTLANMAKWPSAELERGFCLAHIKRTQESLDDLQPDTAHYYVHGCSYPQWVDLLLDDRLKLAQTIDVANGLIPASSLGPQVRLALAEHIGLPIDTEILGGLWVLTSYGVASRGHSALERIIK